MRHVAVAGLAVIAASLAGCAVSPDQDPVQIRLNELDQRIARIERIVSNQSLVQLSQRVEALDGETRRLRGEVDVLNNSSEGLRKQQRDLYADLDRRIAALEGGGSAYGADSGGAGAGNLSLPGAPGAAPAGGGPATEQVAYDAAIEALRAGRYDDAKARFGQLLADWPNGNLADNAQYWLGEAHYVTRDYQAAAAAFARVGEQWPNSRKAPDALVKLGYTQSELKRFDDARRTLGEVIARYPGSDAARLAQERLRSLGG